MALLEAAFLILIVVVDLSGVRLLTWRSKVGVVTGVVEPADDEVEVSLGLGGGTWKARSSCVFPLPTAEGTAAGTADPPLILISEDDVLMGRGREEGRNVAADIAQPNTRIACFPHQEENDTVLILSLLLPQ